MLSYIAYLRKDPDHDYGIEFPDVPGCISAGRTLDEARAMAAEALAGHLQLLCEDGQPIPTPSTLDALRNDPHRGEAMAVLIDLPNDFLTAEPVNVMIPRHVLARIDAVAGGNRSRFMVEAAERMLGS